MTVVFLVGLMFLVSLTQSKTTLSDGAVRRVDHTLAATHILCSPHTVPISSLMNRTLRYLLSPKPQLYFYQSSAKAEEAYLNFKTSVATDHIRVIGIHFDKVAVPSYVNYSVRFRAHDVADTEVLFNHARE